MAISLKLIQNLARINKVGIDLNDESAVKEWFEKSAYNYLAINSADNREFVERVVTALLLLGDKTDKYEGLTASERNEIMRLADNNLLLSEGEYLTRILRIFYAKAGGKDLSSLSLDSVKTTLLDYGCNKKAVETIMGAGISAKVKAVNYAGNVIRANTSTATPIAKAKKIVDTKKAVVDLAEDVYKASGATDRLFADTDITNSNGRVIAKSEQIKNAEKNIASGINHPLTSILKDLTNLDYHTQDVATPDEIINDIQAYLLMNNRLTSVKKADEWKEVRDEMSVDASYAVEKDGSVSIYTPIDGEELETKHNNATKEIKITEFAPVGIESGASFVGYDISKPEVKKAYELLMKGALRPNRKEDRPAIELLNENKLYSSAVGVPVSPKTTAYYIYSNMVDETEGIIGKDGLTSDLRNFFRKIIVNPNSPYHMVDIDNGVTEQNSDKKFELTINDLTDNKLKKLVKTKLQFSTRFITYDEKGEPSTPLKTDDAIKFSVIQSMVLDYVGSLKNKVRNAEFKIVGAEKDDIRDPNERALIANLASQYVMLGYSFGDGQAHRNNEEIISTYLMENQAALLAGLAKSGKDYAVVLPRAYRRAMNIADLILDCLGVDKQLKRDKDGRLIAKSELMKNLERHGYTFPQINSNDQPLFMSAIEKAGLKKADLARVEKEEARLKEMRITPGSLGELLISSIDTQLEPQAITLDPQNTSIEIAENNRYAGAVGKLVREHEAADVIDPTIVFTDADEGKTDIDEKEFVDVISNLPVPIADATQAEETNGKKAPRTLREMLIDRIKASESKKAKNATTENEDVPLLLEGKPEVIILPPSLNDSVDQNESVDQDKIVDQEVITAKQAFKDRMAKGKLNSLFKEKGEKIPTKEAVYGYVDGVFYFAIRNLKTGKVTDKFETKLGKTAIAKIEKATGEERDALIDKYAEKAAKTYKQFKNAKRDTTRE